MIFRNLLIKRIQKLLIDCLPKDGSLSYNNVYKENLSGYCYVLSEALYYVLKNDFCLDVKVYYVRLDEFFGERHTHWFLKLLDDFIIDMTKNQYNFDIPYDKAKQIGFRKMSNRTKQLLSLFYSQVNKRAISQVG